MDIEVENLLDIVVDSQLSGSKRAFWLFSTHHYVTTNNGFSSGNQCIHKYWIY